MIHYNRYTLPNGLTLIVHEDHDTPLATVNILYNVGARDENASRTGFAHLFEHLMFGGTEQVPDFDQVVNGMGGESNAFTNNDITNYYQTVPAQHLETALWLEADRMRKLDFSQKSLSVQQSVVTEEYNQRYINQPYGDVWMLLRPLCYEVHPYRWCTIGSDIRHVQEATLRDVEEFFYRYYRPDNAIMAVAGNVKCEEVLALVEKHFGDIPSAEGGVRHSELPLEPYPAACKRMEVERDVPADAIYKAYLMPDRLDRDYYACDMLSDVLSNGKSSRLYNELVKQRGLFSELDAYITGERDRGLFVVAGKPADQVDMADAEAAIDEALERMKIDRVSDYEMQKVKNKFENTFVYGQYKAAERAMNLCYYEWLGNVDLVNSEPDHYKSITSDDLLRVANMIFRNGRTLIIRRRGDDDQQLRD